MSTTVANPEQALASERSRPAYQAYRVLHFGFIVAPILAGLDKFFHLLANWDMYVAPSVARMLPVSAHTFMLAVGAIEVIAGLLVAWKPRVGAPVVALWLAGIIVNLVSMGAYLDVALRDLGLALGALALWRLASEFDSATSRREG
jgi:hypothetical protein